MRIASIVILALTAVHAAGQGKATSDRVPGRLAQWLRQRLRLLDDLPLALPLDPERLLCWAMRSTR